MIPQKLDCVCVRSRLCVCVCVRACAYENSLSGQGQVCKKNVTSHIWGEGEGVSHKYIKHPVRLFKLPNMLNSHLFFSLTATLPKVNQKVIMYDGHFTLIFLIRT